MVYKKYWPLAFVGSIILILLGLIFALNKNNDKSIYEGEVKINGRNLSVEVVSSPQDTYRGLSNRQAICQTCGMLFVFSDLEKRTFVMRNMLFPLDIIFIADNTVIDIYSNLQPEKSEPKFSYKSSVPVNYVLELNAGMAAEVNLKIGDKIEIKK